MEEEPRPQVSEPPIDHEIGIAVYKRGKLGITIRGGVDWTRLGYMPVRQHSELTTSHFCPRVDLGMFSALAIKGSWTLK